MTFRSPPLKCNPLVSPPELVRCRAFCSESVGGGVRAVGVVPGLVVLGTDWATSDEVSGMPALFAVRTDAAVAGADAHDCSPLSTYPAQVHHLVMNSLRNLASLIFRQYGVPWTRART